MCSPGDQGLVNKTLNPKQSSNSNCGIHYSSKCIYVQDAVFRGSIVPASQIGKLSQCKV